MRLRLLQNNRSYWLRLNFGWRLRFLYCDRFISFSLCFNGNRRFRCARFGREAASIASAG